ncbi:TonB-dependent siderophore receptor [Herbaspirillum sp. CF444]|uniref:TonB-dependent siderophore receptor n=1 Tax=Herbaspirillum sp. CF444 TaxID=1144319 RepID=UPI0002724646|nr:TonB-dependent siderophore receptor [Herbaspirillum sp. CF444]EJL84957.1 TonB-dependent siderophore receptor [Herbaspirillum sp. CF444]
MKRFSPLAISLTLAGAPCVFTTGARAEEPVEAGSLPTVSVTAEDDSAPTYRARSSNIAGFGETPLLDTPASVAVVTEAQLKDQQARLLSDVIKNDASIGENYAPVGYYENISVRGFPLDLASGYRINGLSVVGEQNIALENKEQVEIIKGLSGLQGGVVNAGGLVNYVTKRPADVRSVMFGTDSNGSRYASTDLGTLFGDRKQFGLRVNAAHEDINSYVDNSNGYRDFASVAANWDITSTAHLQFNIEYQKKAQKSVAGYQLLGGTTVPSDVSPSTMLSPQSWAQPVRIDSLNFNTRFDLELNADWRAYVNVGRSRAVIDDYLAFPYGSNVATSFSPTFAANGDFDVYDYRSPDDTRRNDDGQAVLQGNFNTGFLKHDLTAGLSMSRRVVDKSDGISIPVGSDNIYAATPAVLPPSGAAIPASYRNLDSRQQAVFFTDRVRFSDRWQVLAGGRQVWLKEKTYDATGATTRDTDRNQFLPQLALIFKPQANMSLYGSYAETLSMGTSAAFWASNYPTTLPPSVARQLEAGFKYDWSKDLSFTSAIFRMKKAYEYPQPDASGTTFTYVQQGKETHTGIELGASGNVTRQLRLAAGVAFIQARADGTGTPAYDGKQAINVPRVRSAVYADYALASLPGLNLQGSWLYSGSKAATRDGSATVPAYHIFNAGLRYRTSMSGHATTVRLTVDNIFDKRYWKDTGESLGDSYLHLGAPRQARLTVQYDF